MHFKSQTWNEPENTKPGTSKTLNLANQGLSRNLEKRVVDQILKSAD